MTRGEDEAMRAVLGLMVVVAMMGCRKEEVVDTGPFDADADGYAAMEDCDDGDAAVFPDADELCDGIDNDCDGVIDEGDATNAFTFYADFDGDGYGNAEVSTRACAGPANFVVDDADCDDGNALVHPDAAETDCTDPIDYDCDGLIAWADDDADGFALCEDCDDTDAAINPGAIEICDGADNDCDSQTDEDDAVGAPLWFADTDGDGHGDVAVAQAACTPPTDFVAADDDCDDTVATIFPGAFETCNGLDDDCNGDIDEDATNTSIWYLDADGDGLGGTRISMDACTQPAGYADVGTDCNDLNPTVWPGAPELCDGLDNDCDNVVPPLELELRYADRDADGFGDPFTVSGACQAPSSYVADATDCNDADVLAFPGATEICDGADTDCDGTVPLAELQNSYADRDGDGYGDATTAAAVCFAPASYVADATDCDDLDALTWPGAPEICDRRDNDCDQSVPAAELVTVYADADGDGYGNPAVSTSICDAPTGFVAVAGDCDDLDAERNPGAAEICDGKDNNCANGIPAPEIDGDGDGVAACAGDCDDTNPNRFPGNSEACDGVDNDCLGGVPGDEADTDSDGWRICDGDCADGDADSYPGALEFCDTADNDCDGVIDDSAVDPAPFFLDADGDNFGNPLVSFSACSAPPGYVGQPQDCDDTDAGVHPNAVDLPGNGVDEDCDGIEAPRLVYTVARYSGQVWAVDQDSGAVVWIHDGLGELIDVVLGPDGTLYVSDLNDGVVAVSADGTSSSSLVSGLGSVHGLYYDLSRDTLLVTTGGGDIFEVDVFTGASTTVVSLPGSNPIHAVRLAGDERVFISTRADRTLYSWTPSTSLLTPIAVLPESLDLIVPATDGGFWVSAGAAGLVYWIDPWDGTWIEAVDTGEYSYGLCADGRGGDGLLYGDHDNAIVALDPESAATTDVNFALATPWGCATNALSDADGDTFLARALGGDDCDDTDGGTAPGAPDAYGNGVDESCDWVDGTDADGDGNVSVATGGTDCDDSDPAVTYGTPGCEATSCLDLVMGYERALSGVYTVDAIGGAPVDVWCDTGLDGGGYTFLKIDNGTAALAPEAEAACAAVGMQLFIPRSPEHLAVAWSVANDATFGPSAGAGYLYILGIYPRFNGATCTNTAMTSATCGNWRAGDDQRYWVSSTTAIAEPNGDNNVVQSMGYSWNGAGSITAYNDITGGYASTVFLCDVGDKY